MLSHLTVGVCYFCMNCLTVTDIGNSRVAFWTENWFLNPFRWNQWEMTKLHGSNKFECYSTGSRRPEIPTVFQKSSICSVIYELRIETDSCVAVEWVQIHFNPCAKPGDVKQLIKLSLTCNLLFRVSLAWNVCWLLSSLLDEIFKNVSPYLVNHSQKSVSSQLNIFDRIILRQLWEIQCSRRSMSAKQLVLCFPVLLFSNSILLLL